MEGISTKKEHEKLDRDTVRKSQGRIGMETKENTKGNKEMFKLQNELEEFENRIDDVEKVKEVKLPLFQLQRKLTGAKLQLRAGLESGTDVHKQNIFEFKPGEVHCGIQKGWNNLKATGFFWGFFFEQKCWRANQRSILHGGMNQEIIHQTGGVQFPEKPQISKLFVSSLQCQHADG